MDVIVDASWLAFGAFVSLALVNKQNPGQFTDVVVAIKVVARLKRLVFLPRAWLTWESR